MSAIWGTIGGWIGRAFGASVRSPLQQVADAQMASGSYQHTFDSTRNLHELIKETAATCITARASERSILQFIVSYGGKTTNEIALRLQNALDQPSPLLSRVEFLELLSCSYDADGNAAILLIPDEQGFPAEQWILPSGAFAPRFDSIDNPLPIGWQWPDGRSTIRPEELVLLRRGSLRTGPYKGEGVLAQCRGSLEIQEALVRAQFNSLRQGKPDLVMEFPDGVLITPQQAANYQALWNKKFNPSNGEFNIGFAPDGGKVKIIDKKEISYPESRQAVSNAIREAFQCPRILLGDTDNVNHNNGQTAIAIFERTVVLRFGQKLASAYESTFQRLWGPGVKIEVAPFVTESFTHLNQDNGVKTNETVA